MGLNKHSLTLNLSREKSNALCGREKCQTVTKALCSVALQKA